MLIDFHTHCFPDKLAPRAIETLSRESGGLEPFTDGTVSSLLEQMKLSGVDRSVVLSIATNTRQQKSVNDFAVSINKENITAFGSVHPDSPDVFEELERIASLGLKGVKFHPEYQGFFIDEPRMRPIYRKIADLDLITVFHAGRDIGFDTPCHCSPQAIAAALPYFNGAPVIAAHWGGWSYWYGVIDELCGKNIYFDTSFGYGTIPRPVVKRIIKLHGADRILFGTDIPWHCVKWELNLLNSFDLNDNDMDKILWKNACNLLRIYY